MKTSLSLLVGILLVLTTHGQVIPEWEVSNIENKFGKYTAIDNDGNIVVVGNGAYFAFGALNIYLKKYDSDGNLLWENSVAAIQDPTSGVTEMVHANWMGIDSQNNIHIVGYKFSTFSGSCFPSNICKAPSALKVYKFDSSGSLIYNQTYDDLGGGDLTSFSQPNWGELDESDNLYVSSRGLYTDTQGDTDFGPVLLKFDNSGTLIWSDVQDIFSNIISDKGIDYNNGRIAMIANKTTGSGAVLLWDESGNLLWQNASPEGAHEYTDVYLDEAGNVYALSWWWEMPFPTQKVNITKYSLDGNQVFSETYFFDEATTVGRIEPLPSGNLVMAATNWTSIGQGTLYTKIVSSQDGSQIEEFTSALPQVTARVWDLKVSTAGNIYVAGRSDSNGGAPADGWIRGFSPNGDVWSADYDVRDVMAIDVNASEEIYLVTENTWNLVKYASSLSAALACELPYPAVTGLSASENPNGSVELSWTPILGSIGCQVNIAVSPGQPSALVTLLQNEVSSLTIPASPFTMGETYLYRIRCGCSQNPTIVGGWSEIAMFSYGGSGKTTASFEKTIESLGVRGIWTSSIQSEQPRKVNVYPNPSKGHFMLSFDEVPQQSFTAELWSMDGRKLESFHQNMVGEGKVFPIVSTHLPKGIYLLRISIGKETISEKVVIE